MALLTAAAVGVVGYGVAPAGAATASGPQVAPLPTSVAAVVPNVVGQVRQVAESQLSAAGFVPVDRFVADRTCESIGDVISQTPVGGTMANTGTQVVIRVGMRDPNHPCP